MSGSFSLPNSYKVCHLLFTEVTLLIEQFFFGGEALLKEEGQVILEAQQTRLHVSRKFYPPSLQSHRLLC